MKISTKILKKYSSLKLTKELWVQAAQINLLLLASTLDTVTVFAGALSLINDCTQSPFRFQYRLLTMTTFIEIAV